MRLGDSGASTSHVTGAGEREIRTTSGVLAHVNLQAQINGLQRQATAGVLTVEGRAGLIQLVALRGQVLGCIADYEWADQLAEQLTGDAPAEGVAFLARARTRAIFHRFTDALTDLERVQQLGADPAAVVAERAAILQASRTLR